MCPPPVSAESMITGRLVTIKKTQQQPQPSTTKSRKAIVIAPKPPPPESQVCNQPPIVIPLPQLMNGKCTILGSDDQQQQQ